MCELPEQAASLHMRTVILWNNEMVMVFDDQGKQMPEFQGPVQNVATKINAVFRGRWEYGDWGRWMLSNTPIQKSYRETILAESGLVAFYPLGDEE